jgi:Ca-activated chloride channel homolog
MIKSDFSFAQNILPIGTSGITDVLLRFKSDTPTAPRRRLNLSLVIDRSGSMAGGPLSHALKAAQAVIDSLEPTDIVSVVSFDDEVITVVPPQLVVDRSLIKEKIKAIRAGGITNLCGGWLEGCKHVKTHFDSQMINRVLLLTDGHANSGITDLNILTKTASQKLEEGIITTTLGFGDGFQEDLLVGMARAAKGNFYFIQNINDAVQVFAVELDTMKSVVAQNLTVQLELMNGASLKETLSLAAIEKKNGVESIVLGDLLNGEDKLLGLTLNLPELTKSGQHEFVKVTFSADVIVDDVIKSQSGSMVVAAQAGTIEEAVAAPTTGVQFQLARVKIAKAKNMALDLSDQSKFDEAERILRDLMVNIKLQGLHENYEIAEELEQLEYFAARLGNRNVSNNTRKELRDQAFQGLNRNRADLTGRGTEMSDEVVKLTIVSDVTDGIELECIRESGKLRVKVSSGNYDLDKNVQFPRAIRAEGVHYVVSELETSGDGTFYRVKGNISRLLRPGEVDTLAAPVRSSSSRATKASSAPATAADLEVTSDVGDGILVQCVKDGSKLRARVVSDKFESTWNMRFPRSIREEGMLYVAEDVITAPDGKSYIACGKIKRFEQN